MAEFSQTEIAEERGEGKSVSFCVLLRERGKVHLKERGGTKCSSHAKVWTEKRGGEGGWNVGEEEKEAIPKSDRGKWDDAC